MKSIFYCHSDDSYEIWMMAMAIKRGDKTSQYSLDHYEKTIRQTRDLINEAKEKAKTL